MLPLQPVKTPHKILSINSTTKFKQFLRDPNNGRGLSESPDSDNPRQFFQPPENKEPLPDGGKGLRRLSKIVIWLFNNASKMPSLEIITAVDGKGSVGCGVFFADVFCRADVAGGVARVEKKA